MNVAVLARRRRRPKTIDSFNRVDNTASLGSADNAQAWTITNGTGAIAGDRGGFSAITTLAYATLTGSANGKLSLEFPVASQNTRLLFRFTSITDHLLVNADATQWTLYKRVGGALTSLGASGVAATNGDVLTVHYAGPNVFVFINGTLRITANDATHLEAKGFGFGATALTARVDNLRVSR